MAPIAPPTTWYSPLAETNEIRLLELEPGAEHVDICCTLKHATLSEWPSYEALSYEWGSLVNHKTIRVNGSRTQVRENLWSALQQLRLEKASRVLWVDALCINQEDTLERNQQVNQMGAIYSQATRVIVWLGLPDLSSRTVFRLVKQLTSLPRGSLAMAFRLRRSHIDVSNIPSEQDLFDFRDFCWRSYWLRLWIVQEILLAEDIMMQCGKDWCEWTRFRDSLTLLGRMARALGPARDPASMIHVILASIPSKLCKEWLIYREKRSGIDQTPRPWVKILRHYSRCQCQEVKDRILALRALAPSCCQDAVRADYNLSVSALCTALLSHQFLHHASSGVYEAMEVLKLLGLDDRCYLSGGMADVEVIQELVHMTRQDVAGDPGYSIWF